MSELFSLLFGIMKKLNVNFSLSGSSPRKIFCGLIMLAATSTSHAHISLISPAPLMDGYEHKGSALKVPPFGAPGVDVVSAPAITVQSGSYIDIDVDVYVNHPGKIVVLYTQDLSGDDVKPVYSIPSINYPIPHKNLLFTGKSPSVRGENFKARIKLPDVEGDILLVVRQVMHDKIHVDQDSGVVDLSEIYYHQASKLKLVKE